jgi:AcrR family transcriptional regulator
VPTDTRARLVAAAMDLLTDGGLPNVSIRKVAGLVGITPMAVYRHFPDLDALLSEAVEERFRALAASWSDVPRHGSPREMVLEAMAELVRFGVREPHTYDYLFLHARPGGRRYPDDFGPGSSPTLTILVDLLGKATADGDLAEADLLEVATGLSAVVHGLMAMRAGGRLPLSPEAFEALCLRSVGRMLDGLA